MKNVLVDKDGGMRKGFEDLSINDLNYAVVDISHIDGGAVCYCATAEQADGVCDALKAAGQQVDVYAIHR